MSGDLGKSVFIVINLKKIFKNLKSLVFVYNVLKRASQDCFKILKRSYQSPPKFYFAFCM